MRSSGTITTWISKGGVWGKAGLKYCEEARARSGCTPECDSGYGGLAELRSQYAAALLDSDEEKGATRQRSRRKTAVPASYALTRQEVDRRLPVLAQAHKGALRSLDTVTVNHFGSGLDRVTLAEVRVERAAERQVLKHIERQLTGAAPGQAAALVGEPGVGKSCSLWGVYEALARRQDVCLVLLSATSLLAGPGGSADLRPHELPAMLEELRKQTAGARRRTILLLDTADLLLHQPETAHDFVELITVLRSRNTAVALACRKGEAGLLKQRWDTERKSGAYASVLADIPLGLYDDGSEDVHQDGWAPGSELARAVDSYARVYAPARDDSDGSLPQMRRALADAAARGLPLGKLIRHPLHLRMVFDLYAPNGPSGFDLDVAGLFHDYWTWRVDRDMRHAVAAPGAEPDEQALPLGHAAAELGLATLLEGTIELRRETARSLVASRLAVPEARAAHWIGLLLRRGVLGEPFPGRLRFHHQAIGEYAAGRGLAEAPAGLEATVGRITEHPQDLYLAEAARHAFRYRDRAHAGRPNRWYPRLTPLARASSPVARETFLRILAGLRHAPDAALADAVPLIEDPVNGRLLAEHYLAVLNATGQPAERIWPTLLRTIWDAADGPQRREVLRTLTVLLRQQRATAAAFLHGLPAEELPRYALAPQLITLMRHLHEDGAAAPAGRKERTAVAVMDKMLDDAFVRRGAPLEHTLATLAELTAEWSHPYGDVCRGLPKRLAEVPEKIPKDIDKIIASAAACWAVAQAHERTADTLQALRACLEELARGDLPVATHHVVLHGVASTLCHPSIRIATSALFEELTTAAACAPSDNTRKAIARYLLHPLLMASDTPAGRTTRAWCRAQTSHEQVRQNPQPPATTLALTALGVLAGQRLPAPVIAASLPDDRRSEKPRAATLLPWITTPWDPDLTVAAAAGGHHLATHALDRLIGVTPHGQEGEPEVSEQKQSEESPSKDKGKRRRRGRQLRKRLPSPCEEVIARVPEAPGLLLPWLLCDAQRRQGTDALVGLIRASEKQLPAEHADQLRLIAAYLMEQKDHQAKAAAHRLTARMISRGLTPLGTPDSLVEQLDALRTSAVAQTELLEAVTQALTEAPTLWELSTARTILSPALNELVERATTMVATIARPQRGQEAYMLSGNAAHLLRVRLAVLDARRKLTDGAHDIGLEDLHSLAFKPGDLCVPRGHSLTQPGNVWPHRFDTMPRLCVDLHEAGRPQDAEQLLRSAVTAATAESGPSARWRGFAWNPWRPYLRLLASERSHLYDLLIDYGQRDHQLARHLLEVAGQALSNISEELHRLLADPRWPAELRDAARRTASWAGRDGANLRWDTVYDDIDAAAGQRGSGR
ncbi:hypothetical protein RPQ02_39830 [Streptomyces sp. AM2-3-1]|uniref:hypothetical protein n=1 Tax=unclassified Streptomyces TaxID=2593676 RepID=UPI0028C46353|nr:MULTISPECIES: hypothetical protein [unclassified Streptomyces]WNO69480.1 hypothetical protein RPQ02_39830 [Streptomyces sp. AM2-3-1]WSC74258.1 hypothetical protein OG807_40830 [Streptomyces sp. NBC_01760]